MKQEGSVTPRQRRRTKTKPPLVKLPTCELSEAEQIWMRGLVRISAASLLTMPEMTSAVKSINKCCSSPSTDKQAAGMSKCQYMCHTCDEGTFIF